MDLGIKERLALVTGASGGLGSAIGLALAKEGVTVVLAGRDEGRLAHAAEAIRTAGGKAYPVPWDLADLSSFDEKFAHIRREIGEIDILVNNSGGPPPSSSLGVDAGTWEAQFRSMTLSLIKLADYVVPGMRSRKWGRVITSASSGVIAPIPNLAISNTLRAALVSWSKTLASEVAADGVTANIVVPGRIATRRIEELDAAKAKRDGTTVAAAIEASTRAIPAGRYGKVQEYGDVVAFLASERASYITGSVIRVDGGYIPNL